MNGREWLTRVAGVAARRLPPFDGRRDLELLAFCIDVAHSANFRSHRVMLRGLRERHGERLTKRYVAVLADHGWLLMVVKPARGHLGKPGRAAEYAMTAPDTDENADPQDARKGSANARAKRVRVVLSDDPADGTPTGGCVSTTRTPAEHESVAPLVVGRRALVLDARRTMPLALRREAWAGWQFVAPRLTPARVA